MQEWQNGMLNFQIWPQVVSIICIKPGHTWTKSEGATQSAAKERKSDMLVIGEDMEKIDYKLSPCCNPIPGDEVFGFVTINEGIKIHKSN